MKKETKKNNNLGPWVVIFLVVIIGVAIIGIVINKNKTKNANQGVAGQGADGSVSAEAENEVVEEFVSKKDDSTKVNTSSDLKADKTYNGIKITNIQLTAKDNETTLLADVENVSGKDIADFTDIDLVFYDKEGKEIGTIPGIISPLKAGEKSQLNASITADFANAFDFKVTAHKEQ